MTGTFTERPAIGTRVKLEGCPGLWYPEVAGAAGIVSAHSTDPDLVFVAFDGQESDLGEWRYLRPETSPRRPKQGEVWRDLDDGDLVLITGRTDHEGDPETVTLTEGIRYGVGATAYSELVTLEFVYPSLSAAIKAGAIS